MKTPEDEAFDDIERKQREWGGGFPAKRQMAIDKFTAEIHEEYIKYRTAFPKEYTAPQPAQEPVELLLQLRSALALASAICDAVPNRESGHLGTLVNAQPDGSHGYRQIQEAEAALVKYLETPASQPPLPVQPAQEPVAWMSKENDCIFFDADKPNPMDYEFWTPLYTTPPQREWVGLTDEEIDEGNKQSWVTKQAWESAVWWASEKLKEKNNGT